MGKNCKRHALTNKWKDYAEYMDIHKMDEQEQKAFKATFMAGANVVMVAIATAADDEDFKQSFDGLMEEMNTFVQKVILEGSEKKVKH